MEKSLSKKSRVVQEYVKKKAAFPTAYFGPDNKTLSSLPDYGKSNAALPRGKDPSILPFPETIQKGGSMKMKKEKFNEDNFGRVISKDLIKIGRKYGFEVITDQFMYTGVSSGVGDVTELHASAYPSIDESIEINIIYRSVYKGGYSETFEAESSMGRFSSDSADGLFKKLKKALESGIKSVYKVQDIQKLFKGYFDKLNISRGEIAGRIVSHKYMDTEDGAPHRQNWVEDNLEKPFSKDFDIAVEDNGWYFFYPKSHVRIVK